MLRVGFDAFTFRLKPEIHEMELADTVRVEVAVQYKTRAWQTIDIDLGPGEAREVDLVAPAIIGLAEMGLPMTPQVRCLGINEQVAQKLHACTGPQREDRARDVLDILLVDMLGQLSHVRARAPRQNELLRSEIPTDSRRMPHCRRSGKRSLRRLPKNWGTVRPRRWRFSENLKNSLSLSPAPRLHLEHDLILGRGQSQPPTFTPVFHRRCRWRGLD